MAENCRKSYLEELHLLCSSSNITMVIKSGMSWARHVVRMGRKEIRAGFWWISLKVRNDFED